MKEVEIDGRLKIKGWGKVFPNHTHVALSSSLTIFILFFSFDSSGLPELPKGIKSCNLKIRDVAQLGRAQRSGRWGRRFKSCRPDFVQP